MHRNRAVGKDRASVRGFTLLEVVVALAIAALALVGLFRAGSGGLFAADTAARVDEAVERAQSHLAAFGRTGAVAPGELEGDDGGGYHWRLRATAIAQQPDVAQQGLGRAFAAPQQAAGPPTLYDVQVMISWRGGGHDRSVVLETRRLGVAPAAE
jgi:general secretion pathway protein I